MPQAEAQNLVTAGRAGGAASGGVQRVNALPSGGGASFSGGGFSRGRAGAFARGATAARGSGLRAGPGASFGASRQGAVNFNGDRNGCFNNHFDNRFDGRFNNDDGRLRLRGAPWYPPNFPNHGFSTNYDSPYYQNRGFAVNTSPYGFQPTFFPDIRRSGNGFNNGWGNNGWNDNGSNNNGWNGGGFNGNRDLANNFFPYFQGQRDNYRPFGAYGSHGPFTVPAGTTAMAAIQNQLLLRGYYQGPVDGFSGPFTRSAIKAYQYANGIPVTGQVDGYLIRSLRGFY